MKDSTKKTLLNYQKKILKRLKNIYCSKYVYLKLTAFLIAAIITLTCSLVFRQQILESKVKFWEFIPGFLNINIVQNTGIAFSGLQNQSSSLVYFVQSIPVIIGFSILILSRSIFIDLGLSFILWGGLANIIDRTLIDNYKYLHVLNTENAVVDYLQFSFIKNSAVFNFADVSIVFGIIIAVLYVIYIIIKDFFINSKNNSKKSIEEQMISKTIHKEDKNKKKS